MMHPSAAQPPSEFPTFCRLGLGGDWLTGLCTTVQLALGCEVDKWWWRGRLSRRKMQMSEGLRPKV